MPSTTERSRSSEVVLYGTRWDSARSGTRSRICRSSRGRASSFSVSASGPESSTETRVSLGPGVTRDHPREQAKVVLDDEGVDRLRRHVDHPQPRLTQEQQEEEETLLERLARPPGFETTRSSVMEGTTTTDSCGSPRRMERQTSGICAGDGRRPRCEPPRPARPASAGGLQGRSSWHLHRLETDHLVHDHRTAESP